MGPTNKPILTDPASHSQITGRSHQSEPRLTPLDLATLAYGSEDKPHSHRSQIALTDHRSIAPERTMGSVPRKEAVLAADGSHSRLADWSQIESTRDSHSSRLTLTDHGSAALKLMSARAPEKYV